MQFAEVLLHGMSEQQYRAPDLAWGTVVGWLIVGRGREQHKSVNLYEMDN